MRINFTESLLENTHDELFLDTNAVISAEAFDRIAKRYNDWLENGSKASWISMPANLASATQSMQKRYMYFIIAALLGYDELMQRLWKILEDELIYKRQIYKDADHLKAIINDTVVNQNASLTQYIQDAQEKYPAIKAAAGRKTEALEEDIEKHDTLNPKLFENDKLKEEVRAKMLEIVNEFIDGLAEDNIDIKVDDILLIGSNASYNYTKDSDIDLHIIADTSNLHCPYDLYPALYGAYRSLFNKKLDINFYGIPVEIFVETDGTPRVSNGVYSVLHDKWVKEPVQAEIPEIDFDAFDKEFDVWKNKCLALLDQNNSDVTCEDVTNLIDELYVLRKDSIANGGEYSLGNLIFKDLRNKGYLDGLKDLKNSLRSKELSLESLAADEEPEELTEVINELTNKQIYDYRIKIGQLTHTQPLINQYGRFTISNVPEDDASYICRILKAQDFIQNVNSTAGKFDFKGMITTNMPKRLYTITGQIKI